MMSYNRLQGRQMTSFELLRLSHLRDLILVQFLVLLEGKLCTVALAF